MFETAKKFFEDKDGKVMVLNMSSAVNKKDTFVASAGIIDNVMFHDGTGSYNEGFQIHLRDRAGKSYASSENFFGHIDRFEVIEGKFSDTLKLTYKDGSYFDIEVRI
jgi:hypothetical protein